MKTKYNLSCIVINKILEKTNESEENYETGETKKFAIETFYNMLTDIESDLNKLLEKYTQQSKVRRILNNVFKTSNIKKAEQMTSKESDEEFIKKLFEFELFEKKIINVSIEEYHKWKNEDFPNNLKKILPSTQNNKQLDKLKREYEEEKKIIEKNISMRLIVLNVKKSFTYFNVEYDIEELQPNQLQITIYETSLKRR
ncbi:unnamed protein product [Rhizophagus irregularis]|nr:unnamed protein product [Rhizophagus irregularis]